ncbi:hypothetical protein [Neorhizobium vignae]|uniref:hypothetical protein n=1 Tax=Neorhizobium vignae TaxID=690585 RepID=UPI000AE68950|nr:hypothetical protein [Neorhizobium vignae]
MQKLDDSWPGRRRRYSNLKKDVRALTRPDRRIDAELARLMVAAQVVEREES